MTVVPIVGRAREADHERPGALVTTSVLHSSPVGLLDQQRGGHRIALCTSIPFMNHQDRHIRYAVCDNALHQRPARRQAEHPRWGRSL